MTIQVLGIDLGKRQFHVVGHDKHGNELLKEKFTRPKLLKFLQLHPSTTVVFEACCGAHWLGRKCQDMGHTVKLIPPQYVRPYVKTNKNDFIDASAIAEAASRGSMRFVEVKSEQAQLIAATLRIRAGIIKERTARMCRIGAILLEFGLSLPKGHATMKRLLQWIAEQPVEIPLALRMLLQAEHEAYNDANERIAKLDKQLQKQVRQEEKGALLTSIPGVGDLIASHCLAELESVSQFTNGRNMAAWLGLVPRQHSTGGKARLLGISKRGNKHLRTMFIHGARAIMSRPELAVKHFGSWVTDLLATKPFNVATVALANKLARITWAVLHTQQPFDAKS